MLNLENLRARVRGGGFKPLKLHLLDGRKVPAAQPECIAVSRKLVLVAPDDGIGHTIDPLQIVAGSEEATPIAP